ncbi:MAG: hypothetical protein RJA22_55 [Verrucomicrobiota bacterium]
MPELARTCRPAEPALATVLPDPRALPRAAAARPPAADPVEDIRPQGLAARLRFLSTFLVEPFTVGSVWPSSETLARRIAEHCDIRSGHTVVELGPGTGVVTEQLLRRVQEEGGGRLVGVEINRSSATVLRRRLPDCEVIHGSAEHLPRFFGRGGADCIISGLAWGNMMPRLQNRILAAILRALAPGGQFVGFGYAHAAWYPTTRRFQGRLRDRFGRVELSPVIWKNLPPAFIYRCWRH